MNEVLPSLPNRVGTLLLPPPTPAHISLQSHLVSSYWWLLVSGYLVLVVTGFWFLVTGGYWLLLVTGYWFLVTGVTITSDTQVTRLPAHAPVHVPAGASTHTSPPRLHRLLAVLITTVLTIVTMKVVGVTV